MKTETMKNEYEVKLIIRLVFGLLLGITALTLAVIWFNWQLSLIIFLAIWGNNYTLRTE